MVINIIVQEKNSFNVPSEEKEVSTLIVYNYLVATSWLISMCVLAERSAPDCL